jgi:hypothetical protein
VSAAKNSLSAGIPDSSPLDCDSVRLFCCLLAHLQVLHHHPTVLLLLPVACHPCCTCNSLQLLLLLRQQQLPVSQVRLLLREEMLGLSRFISALSYSCQRLVGGCIRSTLTCFQQHPVPEFHCGSSSRCIKPCTATQLEQTREAC